MKANSITKFAHLFWNDVITLDDEWDIATASRLDHIIKAEPSLYHSPCVGFVRKDKCTECGKIAPSKYITILNLYNLPI